MNRRQFLGVLGLSTAGTIPGSGFLVWPDDGFRNPCLAPLPPRLAAHELVKAAWEGVDAQQLWDCHVHLAGVGDGNTGLWINPQMQDWMHPVQYLQRYFYQNASCAEREGQVDQDALARLIELHKDFPRGAKFMLLAFDYFYDAEGQRHEERSAYHAPNTLARYLVQHFPERFEWIASVHPYRNDCVEVLEAVVESGARAIKWLPSAMGIDPASAQCDRFYEALAKLDVPLLTHGGKELAVHGAGTQHYGNPLRLRRALDHGVRVIVAHCASEGSDIDLDRGVHGPEVASFELFARLMDDARYVGRLFGELSALPQVNRSGNPLKTLLERDDWHARLINGSDYPLPGVMPLVSPRRLARDGYLGDAEAELLIEIRRYNPILFDFVLKRHLKSGRKRFAARAFESRRVFLRAPENKGRFKGGRS